MGGMGSNRWGDYQRKMTVEECIAIDIRLLHKNEVFERQAAGTLKARWGSLAFKATNFGDDAHELMLYQFH